jgi:hypothetical protein
VGVFQNIKARLGNLRFAKEVSRLQHERQAVGFDEAKKIGILYDATDPQDFEVIKQYVKEIRAQSKDVMALGFVDKKELSQNQFAQLGLEFFSKKNLNWKMIPNNRAVINFIDEQFDVVINVAKNEIFPLRYIAALSKARFRVGRFDKHFTYCYDLMIHSENNADIKTFIEEAEIYLRKIKRNESE